MGGQLRHGGDARVDQPGPLADPHPGDEQQVVVRADLRRAFGTPEARAHPLVLPGHRPAAGEVLVEQPLQRGPPGPVDRQQFVERVAGRGAVAEHQVDLGGDGHPRVGEGLGVGRQLQQRLDLDRAGQLGVAQPVAAASAGGAVGGVLEDQEVGEPDEPAVEHRGLVDHRCPAGDRLQCLLGRRGQPRDGVGRPADDRDVGVEPAARRGGVVRARRRESRCGPAVRRRRTRRDPSRAARRTSAAARIRSAPRRRGRRRCR